MQAFDSFISPSLGFDGDILILAIPILSRPPGSKTMSDPSAGASAITLKWQVESTSQPDSSKESQENHGELDERDQNQ
jgi:hypothetical protein